MGSTHSKPQDLSDSLQKQRNRIDEIDSQLLTLLNERAKVALEIGYFKKQNQLPIVSLEREQELLDKLKQKNQGVLSGQQIAAIFQQIILAMREVQQKL